MQNYDVVIVGAGPAGLIAGREISKLGYKTIILDKKRDYKDVEYHILGSFLNLREWGLTNNIIAQKIDELYFSSKNISFRIRKKGVANILDRAKLLGELNNQTIESGAKVEYGCFVNDAKIKDNNIINLTYNNLNTITGKIFVDASSTNSILAIKNRLVKPERETALGIELLVPLKTEPKTVDVLIGSYFGGGYAHIAPMNEKTAIIGYNTFNKDENISLMLKKIFQHPRVKERVEYKIIEQKIVLLQTNLIKRFYKGNLVVVGDSAGQVNPLVGEGVRFVMDSAKIASKYIIRSLEENNPNNLKGYQKEWEHRYLEKYKCAKFLQNKAKEFTNNDRTCDLIAKQLSSLSDSDSLRFCKGDINRFFLLKILFNHAIRKLYSSQSNVK